MLVWVLLLTAGGGVSDLLIFFFLFKKNFTNFVLVNGGGEEAERKIATWYEIGMTGLVDPLNKCGGSDLLGLTRRQLLLPRRTDGSESIWGCTFPGAKIVHSLSQGLYSRVCDFWGIGSCI